MAFKKIILIFILIHSFISYLAGQNQGLNSTNSSYIKTFGKPLFIFNTYTFASDKPGKTRLDVHLSFVNDILQFVKEQEDIYKAKYEIVIEIVDGEGNHQEGDLETKVIETPSYEATNARNIVNRHYFAFDLNPGTYKLHLEVTDLNTKRRLTRKKDIVLKNFEGGTLAMSDLMIVDFIDFDSSQVREIIPNMRKTFDEPSSEFGAYFELYCFVQDSIKLNYCVYDYDNNVLLKETNTFHSTQNVIRKFIPLKNLVKVLGRYYLVVEASTRQEKVIARESFFIQYSDKPLSIEFFNNSSALFSALKHITNSSDFSKMEKASAEERIKLIKLFWQQRDPTPGTERNELKEEFYRRVEFTLRHFSITSEDRPGWDTDRGKIYIIYGPPSEVQRRSVDIVSNPYEIWYYGKIDQRFIFLDKSGLGEYRLVHKD